MLTHIHTHTYILLVFISLNKWFKSCLESMTDDYGVLRCKLNKEEAQKALLNLKTCL